MAPMDVIPWTAAFTIHLIMRTVFRTVTVWSGCVWPKTNGTSFWIDKTWHEPTTVVGGRWTAAPGGDEKIMAWLFLLHGTLVPTSVTSVIPIITLRELSWFDPNNDCYLGPWASWEVKPAYGSIALTYSQSRRRTGRNEATWLGIEYV